MLKNAFSMIEIIFSIVIITLISSIAITKFSGTSQYAIITKIQTDLAFIRSHIAKYENKKILLQEEFDLYTLDDSVINSANQKLFEIILQNDIVIISHLNQNGSWIKTASNSYQVRINDDTICKFEYDHSSRRFDCDMDKQWCVRLNE